MAEIESEFDGHGVEWAKRAPKPNRPHMGQDNRYIVFRDALRKRPGRWAKYPVPVTPKAAKDVTYQINTNRRPTFPPEEFEARFEDNACWVRARPKKRQ